ncbi:5,10-methylenetetrahydrofolate reductase [Ornatilinea apprima]|uniref:Methylenetetrahydrofolate reductase n=1 Tax=Ornatilinea apprima TaxID=1134406 RepID=A0A0P6XL89_9CHLR|nr:methylenetetrahydrofolate reductase [NAD(P)H] [Ornatilinea apprima]KPL76998.1 5,10-methylenetetrahydrofolate reductase [Ornatilinea apprima]
MKIADLLKTYKTIFSFEFFPARTPEASEELYQTMTELIPLQPSHVSVTYGAGGSTRELTHNLVLRLHNSAQLTVMPHLTCVGTTRDEVFEILTRYNDAGIENIMALRGDPPKGAEERAIPAGEGFPYAADLVAFIKQHFPQLSVGVAGFTEGHPATPNRLKEIEYLKAKVDAGADFIVTQLFFDNRDFYDYCERCQLAGIQVPVIAGIMPIISKRNMLRMAELAAGVRYPARLLRALARAEDDEDFAKIGRHWATEQVLDLLDHDVRGVHFYTLNKSRSTMQIYDALNLRKVMHSPENRF